MIAIEHDLAFGTARQVEPFHERISRIVTAFARISIAVASVLVAIAQVVKIAV